MSNMGFYERAVRVIPGGAPGGLRREFHEIGPLVVSRAHGARIYDVNGNEYVDYHMAFGAVLLGHGDPDVTAAVKEQIDRLVLHGAGVTDVEVEAAEAVVSTIHAVEMVIFTPSGSEAVMTAIRLARAVTGRDIVVKFEGNYHGWHDYSLYNVVTPIRQGKRPETRGIPKAVQATVEVLPYNDVEAVERLEAEGCDNVAMFILEPVAHSMGVVPADKEFVKAVERVARSCGALLAFDEIITAVRHNIRGMHHEMGVKPDLVVLGKAIANGFPVGALGGRRELMEELTRGVVSSGTYQSHPLSMAAVKASIAKAVRVQVDRVVARKGEEHARLLRDLVEDEHVRAFVAGFRSTVTVYFGLREQPRRLEDVLKAHREAYKAFASVLRRRGVLVTPNPRKRMHISLAHGSEELERMHEAAMDGLREVKKRFPELVEK